MLKHLILTALNLFCLIPFFLLKRKIKYLNCPDEIITHNTKKWIFIFLNFSPSMAVAISSITNSRVYIQSNPKLSAYENYSLLIGLLCLLISLAITGLIVDKIMYYIDLKYRVWRDTGLVTELAEKKDEGDFL